MVITKWYFKTSETNTSHCSYHFEIYILEIDCTCMCPGSILHSLTAGTMTGVLLNNSNFFLNTNDNRFTLLSFEGSEPVYI